MMVKNVITLGKCIPLIIGTLFTIFLLTGCSSLLAPVKTAPIKTYTLSSIPQFCITKPMLPFTLLVTEPQTNSIYDTTLIAYTVKPYEVAYYANNRWAESPPQMLKSLMVQTLQNTHHFRAVVPAPFVGKFDYVLNTQLIRLQQDFCTRCSSVQIIIRAQLINGATSQVVAARQFSVTQPAPQSNPYGGVIAANCATEILLRELAEFTLENL